MRHSSTLQGDNATRPLARFPAQVSILAVPQSVLDTCLRQASFQMLQKMLLTCW